MLLGIWALASAAAALFSFLSTTLPVRYSVAESELPTGPAWIPAWIFTLMVLADLLVTFLMPLLLIPLLVAGLRYLRPRARRQRAVAWAAAIAAGITLEVAYLSNFGGPHTSIYYSGPAVVNWAHLADGAGFLVIGALMLGILNVGHRYSRRAGIVPEDLA